MACRQLEGAAHLRQVSRSSLVRDLARVFQEYIPTLRQVVVDQEGGFADVQSMIILSRIVKGEHTTQRPARRNGTGPRHLHRRIVAVTGHRLGACRRVEG